MSLLGRNSILIGVGLFLEGCALYLLFNILTSLIEVPAAQLPFWLVMVTLLWAYFLSLYLQTIRFSLNLRGAFGLIISVVSLLFLASLSHGFGFIPVATIIASEWTTAVIIMFTLAFLTVLWWRGGAMAHDDVTLESIRGTFQWGVVVVVIGTILDSFSSRETTSGVLVLGFFCVGLAGLSLARFSWESVDSQPMSKDWLLPIGVSVGSVILLGLIISALGLGGLDDLVRAVLRMIGTAGLWILRPILLVMGFFAAGLVALGNWLSSVFGGGNLESLEVAQEQIRQFHESLDNMEKGGPPRLLIAALKGIAFLSVTSLTGWLLFKLFRFRRLWRISSTVEETRESLFSWDKAGKDLGDMLGGWINGLIPFTRNREGTLGEPANPREAYHSFLAFAARIDHPREDWQTPREHQHSVGSSLPTEPMGNIVEGFQLSHYGHGELPPQAMQDLVGDLATIRQQVEAQEQARRQEGNEN